MQAFILALVILGFIALVYQGIAFSSREAASVDRSADVTVQDR